MVLAHFAEDIISIIQPAALVGLIFAIGKLYQRDTTLHKDFHKLQKDFVLLKCATEKLIVSQSKTEVFIESIQCDKLWTVTNTLIKDVAVNRSKINNLSGEISEIKDGIQLLRTEFSKILRISSSS